jgi:hypothetical protein
MLMSQTGHQPRSQSNSANPQVRCPRCGNTDAGEFRYLEDIVRWRQCLRADNNRLFMHAFYRSGEGYEDGQRLRLECRAEPCGTYSGCEFPVPAGVEIKWV